ncbi:MAG: hypothetical protein GY950_35235, partial [bacterium]|nr:hypothetical protein [bacterium]
MKKLDKRSIGDIIALTPMQMGILSHYLKEPGSDRFFEQLRLNVSGAVHTRHFEEAWNVVIENNEMLRAIFRWETLEKPVQVILKEHRLRVRYFDLSCRDAAEMEKHLEATAVHDRQEGFDLGEVPFRVTLCKTGEGFYELIISNHHILYDGWSSSIILKEFFEAYNALNKGNLLPAPPEKAQFKTFVRGLLEQEQSAAKQKKFWDRYLAGFGGKREPAVKRRKKWELPGTGTYHARLSEEIKEKLDGFIKSRNITIASFLYGAWGFLLQQYNAVDDVLFDTTVSGRPEKIKGIENSVGLFINTLPLRVRTLPGETFAAFLARTQNMLREWREFENSSLLSINEQLDEYRRGGSLFDSVVVIENYPIDSVLKQEDSPLTVDSFSITERTHYDLTVIINAFEDIKLDITYNNELFDEKALEELFRIYTGIIHEFLDHPDKKVDELEGGAENERARLLNLLSNNVAEVPGEPGAEFAPPRNPVEEKLARLWAGVLNVSVGDIGIDDNFFDFGGHSLKAGLLAAAVHRAFDVKMPLVEIFRHPTIRESAAYITNASAHGYEAIGPAEKREYYPLSPGQRRLYMLQQLEPGSTFYNGPVPLRLEGPLDKARIEGTFQKLIDRHESLRTSFIQLATDGEPVQKIHADTAFAINDIIVRTEHRSVPARDLSHLIADFITPFNLHAAPLMRVGLMETGSGGLLIVDLHHIITDGISTDTLTREFNRLSQGEALAPVKIQYKDFSQCQNRPLREGD